MNGSFPHTEKTALGKLIPRATHLLKKPSSQNTYSSRKNHDIKSGIRGNSLYRIHELYNIAFAHHNLLTRERRTAVSSELIDEPLQRALRLGNWPAAVSRASVGDPLPEHLGGLVALDTVPVDQVSLQVAHLAEEAAADVARGGARVDPLVGAPTARAPVQAAAQPTRVQVTCRELDTHRHHRQLLTASSTAMGSIWCRRTCRGARGLVPSELEIGVTKIHESSYGCHLLTSATYQLLGFSALTITIQRVSGSPDGIKYGPKALRCLYNILTFLHFKLKN